MTKSKNKGPLWTPDVGLKAEFTRPVTGRRETVCVDGFEEWPARAPRYVGSVKPEGKTMTMVRYFGVYDVSMDMGAPTPSAPRWGMRPSYITLTHWRLAIPTMKVLAADWEPTFVPVVRRVTVTEDQMQALAEAVQALAGECPEPKFAALLAAAKPFVC